MGGLPQQHSPMGASKLPAPARDGKPRLPGDGHRSHTLPAINPVSYALAKSICYRSNPILITDSACQTRGEEGKPAILPRRHNQYGGQTAACMIEFEAAEEKKYI